MITKLENRIEGKGEVKGFLFTKEFKQMTKTPILYTNPFKISKELQQTILSHSFDVEILQEIKDQLEDSNADHDGKFGHLIYEIDQILKSENDVRKYLDVGLGYEPVVWKREYNPEISPLDR